ncbi:TB2/DP1/HVA22-related protein [Parasponia andersonii]|uniref:HVA22-like protein n=1 Tax=Parasponia andersonii TaxID=3476 RepID=A0A2P5D9W1_PARAD|nr:TB2/DP1/HVA22-related protein [Parasponia andersonii]
MLGELISRILVMIFGYAYPAFECYKAVENNRAGIEELRFWCQYWILVAILSVLERVGDAFISWLPMYGELKLALFIYLWYPKTKGTDYVYDAILRPYVAKHEIDIDHKLLEWRARAWDLALFYWKNCTELGQSAFFQVIHYVASQSGRSGGNSGSERTTNRAISETTKSKIVQLRPPKETEYVHIDEASFAEPALKQDGVANPEGGILNQARQRLRRFKPLN